MPCCDCAVTAVLGLQGLLEQTGTANVSSHSCTRASNLVISNALVVVAVVIVVRAAISHSIVAVIVVLGAVAVTVEVVVIRSGGYRSKSVVVVW